MTKIPNNEKQVSENVSELLKDESCVKNVTYDDGAVIVTVDGSQEDFDRVSGKLDVLPTRIGDGVQEGGLCYIFNGELFD